MAFEWDRYKARVNAIKHGVDFETATQAFFDPNALIEPDDSCTDEERWRLIGTANGNVLFVVYVERTRPDEIRRNRFETIHRIISARRATRHEQDRYFRQTFP